MKGTDIKEYLTGATSDGGVQTDPNLSFGNFRSSTVLVNKKDATAPSAITGVTIDFASSANADGAGTLTYTLSGNQLQWTAPGDTIGAAVGFTADATKLLYSANESMFIQVTVVFASLPGAAAGPDSITISDNTGTKNNIYDNVSSAEASPGDTEYRCKAYKNEHATETAFGAKVHISAETPGADSWDIAVQAPSSQPSGNADTIANESTAPTTPTFSHPITVGTALSIGDLAPGQIYFVWMKRIVPASTASYGNNFCHTTLTFDAASLEN